MDHEVTAVVYSREEIARRVKELGSEISKHYSPGTEIIVLALLKGSFVFVADLVREIDRDLRVEFLTASSYGSDKVSSGRVELLHDLHVSVEGKHVLLVEDIIDSGNTLRFLLPMLAERRPASLEICTLLHKGKAELPKGVQWVGFHTPDRFLVGYGLDYDERFRNLPYIGSV